MRGERTTDRQALIGRYGVSARLAARVVALQGENIDLTGTLLEMAGSDDALASLLLDRQLLSQADELSEEWIRDMAREHGVEEADLLRVVEGDNGWRTLALEDDVLAEQVQGERPEDEGSEQMGIAPAGEGEMPAVNAEELFSPEEVARLKLTALTSQNAQERIEALRKLVYAPAADQDKASVFVQVLVDPSAETGVRRQAVRCLEEIGFREELTQTVRRLFEATDEDVLYAIDRLKSLLRDAEDSEQGVALAVSLRVFEDCDRPPVLRELLGLIGGVAAVLTGNRQKTEQLIQGALRNLTRFYDELAGPVEDALEACHRAAPDMVMSELRKELGRTSDSRVRAFVINFMGRVSHDEEIRKELADAAVDEILNADLPEDQRSQLRYALLRMGEPVVKVACSRLRSASGRRSAELVRLLDVVCTEGEVSDESVNKAVDTLLDTLQVGEQTTRRRILESSVIADARTEPELQRRVARELLAHTTEFRMKSTVDTICHTLEQIGPAAAPPLLDFVRRRYPKEEVEEPFLSLGRMARRYGDELPNDVIAGSLDFCMGLFGDRRASRGSFTVPLAYLAGYTTKGEEVFQEALETMTDRAGEAGMTFSVFEALGIMAGAPNASPENQRELFELFRQILHMKTPGMLGKVRQTEEGKVYEFGSEMMFDSHLLPNVVQGLEQIGVSPTAPLDLRETVVKELLVLWEGVSRVRVVWGPAAMGKLIRAICNVASCDHVPSEMRARLGRSVLRFLNKIKVVRSLGDVCSRPARDEPMRELCLEVGERMLEEWETSDQQDEERRIALLKALGHVASNPGLEDDRREVKRLRENVVDALFQALREGIDEVREPMERMRDCAGLSEELRDDIRDRLSRVFGLVRREKG